MFLEKANTPDGDKCGIFFLVAINILLSSSVCDFSSVINKISFIHNNKLLLSFEGFAE